MSCNSCNNCGTPITYVYNTTPCTTSSSTSATYDAESVMYTGPALPALGVEPNTTLQDLLAEINTAVGGISGIDWSSFDYSCLGPYTTAEQFAEGISAAHCTLSTNFTTFTDTTYANKITEIEGEIETINEPSLTSCAAVGVVPTDNVSAILTKVLNNLCSVNASINPSSANWNEYFVTSPTPTTIVAGFNAVISQLGNLIDTVGNYEALPTFNNVGSCLPSPTTTDTLYNTVVNIRDLLCSAPEFDIDNISWTSCIANPNPGGGADIMSTIQTLVNLLDTTYLARVTSWDSTYFDVTYNSPGEPCSGYSVTLQSGLGFEDKLVALNGADSTPDYLLNKMTAGTNISFDTSTTPGTVIINSTAADVLVKANAADAAAGYLINKIDGQTDATGAISVVESYNSSTDKVDITPAINYAVLTEQILTIIGSNNELLSAFNTLVCAAQPCTDTDKTISVIVTTVSGSDNTEYRVQVNQSTPTLAMYDSGNVVATSGTVLSSGNYTVTSASIPVSGTLTIVNNNVGAELPYNIYVEDENGDAVSGSTTQEGSIAASDTLTINPFTFGSVTNMVVNIELGSALTTTTTSTTTTTTTTGA